jgi:ribosome-associated protein
MIKLNDADIHYQSTRSTGPGGQHINKVESAILLRFNVLNASIPEEIRARLISLLGKKLTNSGDLIIKANRFRHQDRNKQDALERLMHWLNRAALPPKKRKKTKPTRASKQKRLNTKKLRGKVKSLRAGKISNQS